jgi:hypothetical protein
MIVRDNAMVAVDDTMIMSMFRTIRQNDGASAHDEARFMIWRHSVEIVTETTISSTMETPTIVETFTRQACDVPRHPTFSTRCRAGCKIAVTMEALTLVSLLGL